MDIFFWGGGGGVGNHKIGLVLGVILCILGSFLKVKVQNWGYVFGFIGFQIVFRVLDIPDI